MPRRRQGQNIFVFAPTNLHKTSTSRSYSSVFAPTNSRSTSTSSSYKYAPASFINRSVVSKGYYDYAPNYSTSTYQDYAPLYYSSQSYKLKFSPSFDYEYFYRYAPSTTNELDYEPKLVSRFKPQSVIVSNTDTLDSYFRYVIQLLRVLR